MSPNFRRSEKSKRKRKEVVPASHNPATVAAKVTFSHFLPVSLRRVARSLNSSFSFVSLVGCFLLYAQLGWKLFGWKELASHSKKILRRRLPVPRAYC